MFLLGVSLYSATIDIQTDKQEYQYNEQFVHTINLVENTDIRGVYFELMFDTSLITVDSIKKDPVLSGFMDYACEIKNNRVLMVSVKKSTGYIAAMNTLFAVFGRTKAKEGTLQYAVSPNRVNLIDELNKQIACTFVLPTITITANANTERYGGGVATAIAISPNPVNGPMTISFNTLDKVSTYIPQICLYIA